MNSELLYVFGTGNATVTNLYNTCFALRDGDEYFMVDAGGGNGILKILDNMQVPLEHIHHIFVTHAHTDHVLGIVWMVRMIATKMKKDQYVGDAYIYCHSELIETIRTLCRLTIQDKFYNMIGNRIHLEEVKDGPRSRASGRRGRARCRGRRADGSGSPCRSRCGAAYRGRPAP